MANLYFHYPFCKQACHYCNFHFSTSLKQKNRMWKALKNELIQRADELQSPIESVYFGGGSPSLLNAEEIQNIMDRIRNLVDVSPVLEVTLEVNPDDVSAAYLKGLKAAGVNRLSLGVQSFIDRDLTLMNRAHDSAQALQALEEVSTHFTNYSLDLIYGMPYSNSAEWEQNIETALSFTPPHVSSYALTVEPKTALDHQVKKGEVLLLPEEAVHEHYQLMIQKMEEKGYVNYEFSNFGKPGFFSVNNQNYWNGKPYVGIGPAAHSYDGVSIRKWNVANNLLYLKAIENGKLPSEEEKLTKRDRYNEYVMTGLRTIEGISLEFVESTFGSTYAKYLEAQAARQLETQDLYWDGDHLKIAKSAKFLTDGLAANLFKV
jgi:oxygen-independent coproporphyrinogen-3 oxidase